MTAPPQHVHEGLLALFRLVRESDAAKLLRYERRIAEAAQRSWESAWPAARDVLLKQETAEEMAAALKRVGSMLTDKTAASDASNIAEQLVNAYALGHTSVTVKRAIDDDLKDKLGEEAFTVRDQRAINWLERDTMYWVGNAWDEGLGAAISKSAMRAFEHERPETVAKNLATSMASYNKPEAYWNVVANAAVVRGQSMGQVSGLNAAGAKSYRFQALIDARTTQICRDMDGKIFTMDQANAHVDRVIETESPDEMKEAWPWVQPTDIAGKSPDELAADGVMMPPLHGNCRSVIVVEEFGP